MIFLVGLPKSGTTSLHTLFRQLGYASYHQVYGEQYIGDLVCKCYRKNERLFSFLPQEGENVCITQMDVCTAPDMNYWPQCTMLDVIYDQYRDSTFILNTRNPLKVLRSMKGWNPIPGKGTLAERIFAFNPELLPKDIDDNDAKLLAFIERHYDSVRKFFANIDDVKFIEYDIERDTISKLQPYVDVSGTCMPWENMRRKKSMAFPKKALGRLRRMWRSCRIVLRSILLSRKQAGTKTAVCLIHKDENQFLQEFVDHYFSIGFDEIHIYDNGSRVRPEFSDERIRVIEWQDTQPEKQRRAYNHFIDRNRHRIDWALFVDTDEYLVLRQHRTVQEFIAKYAGKTHCIVVHWLIYGSSHLDAIKNHAELHLHSDPLYRHNEHVKSLARIRYMDSVHSIHNVLGYGARNTLGERVNESTSKRVTHDVAYIKHYVTRGKFDFVDKMQRGEGNSGKKKSMAFFDDMERSCNLYSERTYVLSQTPHP